MGGTAELRVGGHGMLGMVCKGVFQEIVGMVGIVSAGVMVGIVARMAAIWCAMGNMAGHRECVVGVRVLARSTGEAWQEW